MNRILKGAAAATLIGALAASAAVPAQARMSRAGAAAIGFGAGAVVGAAAANAANQGYYGPRAEVYGPGPYAYEPYGYASASQPGYDYQYFGDRNWQEKITCNPASMNYTDCE